jgi:aconitate hydratase
MADKAGILGDLIRAGFRILESACGPCIGMGFAPNSEGVSLRTFNRNFKGRSGTADAGIYLVSPETAAASAITGFITDPTTLEYDDKAYTKNGRISLLDGEDPRLSSNDVLEDATDEGLLIPPLAEKYTSQVEILRGPNIKPCPPCKPCADSLKLPVLLKAGSNVSTDDIMPAGTKVVPFRSNIPEISKFTYERLDADFYKKAEAINFSGCFVVGAENFGQGSSREHAALGPMYLGVRAVIVKSFARIHKANLINYGIIPITFANPADYDKIEAGDTLELTEIKESLSKGTPFKLTLHSKNGDVQIEGVNDLAERSRKILLEGGLAVYTRNGGQ